MQLTVFDTPVLGTLGRWMARGFLRLMKWRAEGGVPEDPRCVLVAAPHTSTWDFPIMLAIAFVLKAKIFWIGKKDIFRWPFGGFFRWLGGISIDRERAATVATQAIQALRNHDAMTLLIPPEGTRGKVRRWKRGFHTIAKGAGVPIVMGYLDYQRRRGGFGPVLMPTDDADADMQVMREFYSGVTAKFPDQFCLPGTPGGE